MGSLRVLVGACLAAFAVGLGVTVAYRMQTEAMAVVVGVLCGVGASLPVSLLLLYAVRQGQRTAPPAAPPTALAPTAPHPPQQPSIIVVAPGLPNQQGQTWSYPGLPAGTLATPSRPPRDFTIIGDDET
ncbi:MAG: hypothetical protein KIS91_09005 [Anaerolineae bacterium]|jgi:hypothetical protein|nr:hypothetical protein [Anaerolineae bacterium]